MTDELNPYASYELTVDDLVAFVQFHHAQSPSAHRQRMGCLLIAFVAMLLLPGLILLTGEKPFLQTARDIWPLLLGPLLFLAFVFPCIKWRTANLSKRMLSEGSNAGFHGECSLSLDVDGIRESKTSGDTVRTWSAVEKIVVTQEYLFIYTSGIEAFVVPRRAFPSSTDFNAFVQHVADQSSVDIQNA